MSVDNKKIVGGLLKTKDGGIIPASKAVIAGDYIYVSGQLAFGADGSVVGADVAEQTYIAMENIRSILAEAGAELSDIVKCTCWISDEAYFEDFNEAYASFFPNEPPARSCIPATLLFNGKVEVEAIAFKPNQK